MRKSTFVAALGTAVTTGGAIAALAVLPLHSVSAQNTGTTDTPTTVAAAESTTSTTAAASGTAGAAADPTTTTTVASGAASSTTQTYTRDAGTQACQSNDYSTNQD